MTKIKVHLKVHLKVKGIMDSVKNSNTFRRKIRKRDQSEKICKGCEFKMRMEDFRIYYYKPKGSDKKELRRVSKCSNCVDKKRRLKENHKKFIKENSRSESSKISDWLKDVSSVKKS